MRGRLRALVRTGLLSAAAEPDGAGEARWEMQAAIRDAACALAEELGLGHVAARYLHFKLERFLMSGSRARSVYLWYSSSSGIAGRCW